MQIVLQKDVSSMIEEFLLHLPFKDRGCFLWFAGVCAVLCNILGKRINRMFRGMDRDPSERLGP